MSAPRKTLDSLRRSIDALDDGIHDALMKRAELSLEVGETKGGGGAALRPGREHARRIFAVENKIANLGAGLVHFGIQQLMLWREVARIQFMPGTGQHGETAALPKLPSPLPAGVGF